MARTRKPATKTSAGELTPAQLVSQLIKEKLDPERSAKFADLIVIAARQYKPHFSKRATRSCFLQIAETFEQAIAAINASSSDEVYFAPMYYLSVYAMRRFPNALRSRTTNGGHWKIPDAAPVPDADALRVYLQEYAYLARSFAANLPVPQRGRPHDFETFRPVLLCAQEWLRAFGKRPGTGRESPFVRACRVVLPLFGKAVPNKLHEHIATAFSYVNSDMLSPDKSPRKSNKTGRESG